jgi:hypothetical protein
MTDIFFAYNSAAEDTFLSRNWSTPLCILTAFPYLRAWERVAGIAKVRRLMLDSGAYSAWNSGLTIDINELIEAILKGSWDLAVTLDVIGDPHASLKNALQMKAAGCHAMPVFHVGEPWEILDEYCKEFDIVGLSCRFGEPLSESYKFTEDCFRRQWPKQFHSFGWVSKDILTRYPFSTADTASWVRQPRQFGTSRLLGEINANRRNSQKLSIRGSYKAKVSLEGEIQYYLKLQRFLKFRWRKELERWTTPLAISGKSQTTR